MVVVSSEDNISCLFNFFHYFSAMFDDGALDNKEIASKPSCKL